MLSLGNLNSSSKAAVFKTFSDASLQFYGKMVRDYNMNSIQNPTRCDELNPQNFFLVFSSLKVESLPNLSLFL